MNADAFRDHMIRKSDFKHLHHNVKQIMLLAFLKTLSCGVSEEGQTQLSEKWR